MINNWILQLRRRSLVMQLFQVSSLHSLSIGLKVVNTFLWMWANNPAFLGFFSLLGVPGSVSQLANSASQIAWAQIPGKSVKEEGEIIKTALVIDLLLMGLLGIAVTLVFVFTKAKLLSELGWPLYGVAVGISMFEPLPALAGYSCTARSRRKWYFVLSNIKQVTLVLLLAFFLVSNTLGTVAALAAFVIINAVNVGAAFFYLVHHRIPLLSAKYDRRFFSHFKQSVGIIFLNRAAHIFMGSISSFYIAFLGDPKSVGTFSFAWTVSNFVYFGISPILDQVFGPRISVAASTATPDQTQGLSQLVKRCALIALTLGIFCGVSASVMLPWMLVKLGKTEFIGSTTLLVPLLVYQVILATSFSFTFPRFCQRAYMDTAMAYFAAALTALAWMKWAPVPGARIYAFPLMGLVLLMSSMGFYALSRRRVVQTDQIGQTP